MRHFAVIKYISATLLVSMVALSSTKTYPAETPLKKLAVAYPSFSAYMLWFLLEKDLAFFRDEGLGPEFILVRGGGLVAKGLITGNFDYAHTTGAVMDTIVRSQQPLRIVFTAAKLNYWLIAKPEIRSITDLKGKTVSTGGLGSITEVTIREIFKRHGLDPFRDVGLVGVGASQDRFAALVSGAVQAAVLTTPFDFKAVQMGYRVLAKATDYVRWPAAGIATREEKISREPSEVLKMVRASYKGLQFILTQREYVLSKMMQMFRLNRDEAIQNYETLRDEVFVPSGYLTEEDQRAAILIMQQAANITGQISPERVFDNRFVKQAEQELKGWQPQIPR